jgi:hypothetical protein
MHDISIISQPQYIISTLAKCRVYRLLSCLFIKITNKNWSLGMKKIIAGLALLSVSSVAGAVSAGGEGCGWGQALFTGSSGTPSHVLAGTTNAFIGNNTFGMTTGTNGCSTSGTLSYGGQSVVSAIMDEFTEDVARGEGDALDTVAVVYGVEPQDRDTFAKAMHENFNVLFPSEDVTAEEMMASIEEIMKSDATLSKYVA